MKFKLTEDWIHEYSFLDRKMTKKIYDKGHVFEPIDGYYEITYQIGETFKFTESDMKSFDILKEVKEESDDFEIIIEEIPDDDDILVRNWRIQLDVKTTRKKLKEIQQIVEEQIKPILK